MEKVDYSFLVGNRQEGKYWEVHLVFGIHERNHKCGWFGDAKKVGYSFCLAKRPETRSWDTKKCMIRRSCTQLMMSMIYLCAFDPKILKADTYYSFMGFESSLQLEMCFRNGNAISFHNACSMHSCGCSVHSLFFVFQLLMKENVIVEIFCISLAIGFYLWEIIRLLIMLPQNCSSSKVETSFRHWKFV